MTTRGECRRGWSQVGEERATQSLRKWGHTGAKKRDVTVVADSFLALYPHCVSGWVSMGERHEVVSVGRREYGAVQQ